MQIVHRQAVVMSFGDVFVMLTVGYLFLACLVFFVRKIDIMKQPGRR
jgi:DHA2 family multidrug resistance protein